MEFARRYDGFGLRRLPPFIKDTLSKNGLIIFRTTMTTTRDFGYLFSLTPVLLVIAGNLLGGYWALGNTLFSLVFLVIIDWCFGEDMAAPLQRSSFIPDVILLLHVGLHTAAVASLVYGISSGILTGNFVWWAAVSTGINSGISGITIAHELIHRDSKAWRSLGIWNLMLVGYAHFTVEHIRGHHKHVGTPKDAATARRGETAYGFFIRTVPEQFLSAVHLEATRLRKKNQSPFGLQNFVLTTALMEILGAILLYTLLGGGVAGAFLVQAVVAVFLLELTNYAQHYGLERDETERVRPEHSWDTNNISSRIMMMELVRHADHHAHAAKPYHELLTYPESPALPTGYLGLLPIVLVPPLWFKMTDAALARHREKSKSLG